MRPTQIIEACLGSHRRLLANLAPLTDPDMRAPSLLPGYTRAHVVTHVIEKTRGHVRVLAGARANRVVSAQPEGHDPDAAAERGAARSADELRVELATAFRALEGAWDALDQSPGTDQWQRRGAMSAGERTMVEIAGHHLRDVEVHHVDLTIGYEPRDWPRLLLANELPKRLAALPDRADRAHLLAWLLGRAQAPDLTVPW